LPIIIICTHEDNYCSDKFNRMLAKLPQPKEVIMAKDDIETTLNKVIGAISGSEEDYTQDLDDED